MSEETNEYMGMEDRPKEGIPFSIPCPTLGTCCYFSHLSFGLPSELPFPLRDGQLTRNGSKQRALKVGMYFSAKRTKGNIAGLFLPASSQL